MEVTKEFALGDVLSMTTGRLVSRRHMDGLYEILNWMTQSSLFTHALPRASEECRPVLLAAYPALNSVEIPENLNAENWEAWLVIQEAKYGDRFEIPQLATFEHKDPIAELIEMGVAPEKIVVVTPDDLS